MMKNLGDDGWQNVSNTQRRHSGRIRKVFGPLYEKMRVYLYVLGSSMKHRIC